MNTVSDDIRTARHFDELRKRREQVAMTLRHLGKEQAEVERNSEWANRAAYEKRSRLLARLFTWYATEIDEIDRVLTRGKPNRHSRCLICHELIVEPSMVGAPESEFCRGCRTREDGKTR
jgi:formylmethanofuran dehydrogenase subunit E